MSNSNDSNLSRAEPAVSVQAVGDGVLTYAELRQFFKGDRKVADYFVTQIDNYESHGGGTGDGVITLAEWFVVFVVLVRF